MPMHDYFGKFAALRLNLTFYWLSQCQQLMLNVALLRLVGTQIEAELVTTTLLGSCALQLRDLDSFIVLFKNNNHQIQLYYCTYAYCAIPVKACISDMWGRKLTGRGGGGGIPVPPTLYTTL